MILEFLAYAMPYGVTVAALVAWSDWRQEKMMRHERRLVARLNKLISDKVNYAEMQEVIIAATKQIETLQDVARTRQRMIDGLRAKVEAYEKMLENRQKQKQNATKPYKPYKPYKKPYKKPDVKDGDDKVDMRSDS